SLVFFATKDIAEILVASPRLFAASNASKSLLHPVASANHLAARHHTWLGVNYLAARKQAACLVQRKSRFVVAIFKLDGVVFPRSTDLSVQFRAKPFHHLQEERLRGFDRD